MDIEKQEMEKLLEEAEQTLYFCSCCMPLVYTADSERYAAEITELLKKVEKEAMETRDKITAALVLLHVERAKEKASA